MATIDEMIEVMQAYKDGKTIEYGKLGERWSTASSPSWNWLGLEYRIAPVQPKKTKKVQLYAYLGYTELRYFAVELASQPTAHDFYKRVPSEDKVVEVEE